VALGGLAADLGPELAKTYKAKLMWTVIDGKTIEDWVNGSISFARRVRGLGVTVALHPHLKSPVETPEQISRLFAGIDRSANPNIAMCLDPGHLTGVHANVVDVIEEFKDWIGMVHITDYVRPPIGDPIVFEDNFVDLGTGEVDYPPILEKLQEIGYDGWYVIEAHFPKKNTPRETVRLNRERFEDLFARAS